jgi:NAD(P)-dependent dehydrogenase (short-subunit alcohol dehydrogenase family)
MKLKDKVALVIGAGSGLGRASAEACAADGAKVIVADISEDGGNETVATITAAGGTAKFVRIDVTDEESVKNAVAATVGEYGKLDTLINSAGGGSGSRTGTERWLRTVDMFLKGPFYACLHALPEMEKNASGCIINVASLSGVTGAPVNSIFDTGYACAKHGLIGLTRTLALTYAKQNIRVNAICPGYMKSALTQPMMDAPDGGQSLISDKLRIPMDRWGEPEEIGKVAAFLASDDASFITGQPIIVDGGFMAR